MYLNKDWYDDKEILKFIKESKEFLTETASAQTRMKLARAARRTAKRRAVINKLRAKKRKLNPVLKKRAYNEVKTAFRKRLYKGNWSKLSYANRARIDGVINKRKTVINRMVKRIMPAVLRGETKRIQSLNKRKK